MLIARLEPVIPRLQKSCSLDGGNSVVRHLWTHRHPPGRWFQTKTACSFRKYAYAWRSLIFFWRFWRGDWHYRRRNWSNRFDCSAYDIFDRFLDRSSLTSN